MSDNVFFHRLGCQHGIDIDKGDHLLPSEHKICITFVQCWTNVEDVGPTLYKCNTHVSCLQGTTSMQTEFIFTTYINVYFDRMGVSMVLISTIVIIYYNINADRIHIYNL